jgi:phospholipase C
MPTLDPLRTLVVVMMENRSFDHMLGYLSLPPANRVDVDGQSADPAWVGKFTNVDGTLRIPPFLSTNPFTMPAEFDPPHERSNIAAQIDPGQDGTYPMTGFVGAIPAAVSADPAIRRLVMSYFGAAQAPMNDFFARNFTVCDRWFCSLPAGTQPNRLMSMSGVSLLDVNQTPLPEQDLVYKWLDDHQVNWRVYHQQLPFFALMPKWIPAILFDERFRSFADLESDLLNTPPDELPQVIFVEPTYQDAPHTGFSSDDHAPAGISNGQEFLMQVYNAVIASPAFWAGAVMVVNYDEHGGFFDHVPPPRIRTEPPAGAAYSTPFSTLGPRVPAFVISPFARPGFAGHNLLDHTSVLKLLGEKFGQGSYSAEVDARPVESVSRLLDFANPRLDPPAPPALDAYLAGRPAAPAGVVMPAPKTALQRGFRDALDGMKRNGANASHPKFGQLLQ